MYKPNVDSTFDIRRRENFKHDLMITDIHLALHKTGKLLEWRQPRQKLKGGLNEDARFEMAVPMPERTGKIMFYLEADTGVEPDWMIEDKLKRFRRRDDERFNVLFVSRLFATDRRSRTGSVASRRWRRVRLTATARPPRPGEPPRPEPSLALAGPCLLAGGRVFVFEDSQHEDRGVVTKIAPLGLQQGLVDGRCRDRRVEVDAALHDRDELFDAMLVATDLGQPVV